jgi:hypothetical protein
MRRPAPGLLGEASAELTPLFSRHTLGVIEAERDRRRQRGARGTIAHSGTTRERAPSARHGRIAVAAASNARAASQAHLEMERWIDEGGLVPFEAAAVLRHDRRR